MTRKKMRPMMPRPLDLARFSRRDFLKMGGTGLAGAALLGTAGCGSLFGGGQGGGNGGGGGGGNSITINLGDAIRDLNSTTTTDSVSTDVLLNVMDGLYRLDENTEAQPAIAEGVEISDDQLNYTFTLRDGVQWSDGSPVTAQDFEYAWLRALDPETAGQYAFIIGQFVEGGTEFNAGEGSREDVGIRATDDKTLEVTLAAPAPFFLGLTSFFTYLPQKQSFVEEQSDNYAQGADGLLYNGPYTLTEFNSTKGVTFEKNDRYWNADNVDIPKVEAVIVTEQDTIVNLYEGGDLDVAGLSAEYVDEYRDSPEFNTQTFFATFYLTWNYENEIFQNSNILKAIQMGFDRQAIADQILNNGSKPATGYVPEGMAANGGDDQTFREVQGPTVPEFNADEARRLFEQGVEELGQEPGEIELLVYEGDPAEDVAAFLQEQFRKNLGLQTRIKVQPFDAKLQLEADGDFEMSWQGWIGDYNDPMTFLDLYLSDSSFNTGGYQNDQYDQLITDAQAEADPAARLELMQEAERLLVEEDAAVAPIFFDGEAELIRSNIKNYVDHPYGGGIDLSLWRLEG
ncbi:peptide ABC transporter substrate-binding protein [Rubrobacter tropicus]|uniref:Peptide ABC transporter substrate-binding protein n=1 Tax=Rubrobacter tropicus TaxID=2653851 RepID=A0A6G8Q7R9_9ACTN|nr:ABC transporter substrate-binding protein [Rubrobacter tropicus]QIN82367.1 peptide ABC transporter substrate-binding protein [Rubrobacter tropicus]